MELLEERSSEKNAVDFQKCREMQELHFHSANICYPSQPPRDNGCFCFSSSSEFLSEGHSKQQSCQQDSLGNVMSRPSTPTQKGESGRVGKDGSNSYYLYTIYKIIFLFWRQPTHTAYTLRIIGNFSIQERAKSAWICRNPIQSSVPNRFMPIKAILSHRSQFYIQETSRNLRDVSQRSLTSTGFYPTNYTVSDIDTH